MIIVKTPIVGEEVVGSSAPVVEPRLGLGVTLTGSDGSSWDLYNGPVRLLAGASGFGSPTPEHWWKSSPALDGSTWQGMRIPHRELTLPVYIHTPSSLEWRDTSAAFFAAIEPGQEATLTVVTPDAGVRSLPVRFTGGGDVDLDIDPLLLRYGAYALTFVAADPYWQGQQVTSRFEVVTTVPMFPGPPFGINATHAIGSATVTNPGDVDAWPRWTVTGPCSSFTLGVGDSLVTVAASIALGKTATVDMDPRRRTISADDGSDLWLSTTVADFAAIPAGKDVALSLDVGGAGVGTAIDLEFTPRYRMAW